MSKFTGIAAFIVGAAIGSVVTWYFLKDKYEKITQEEIDSVKEVFSKRYSEKDKKTEEPQSVSEKSDENDVSDKPEVESQNVSEDSDDEDDELDNVDYSKLYSCIINHSPEIKFDKPFVIPPSEFGMEDDYDEISLTYYADKILADENDEIVEDVEGLVGFESLSHFGEYEDDSVFVRNDRLKCDIEILLDVDRYDSRRR